MVAEMNQLHSSRVDFRGSALVKYPRATAIPTEDSAPRTSHLLPGPISEGAINSLYLHSVDQDSGQWTVGTQLISKHSKALRTGSRKQAKSRSKHLALMPKIDTGQVSAIW